MRSRLVLVTALAAIVLAACADGGGDAEADVVSADGQELGTVKVSDASGDKVKLEASLEDLEPGFHAFHIHDAGVCEANAEGGAFMSAKGHWRGEQTDTPHGEHPGDLPSLFVAEDGMAELTVEVDAAGVGALLSDDGVAFIVHASKDNFGNVPDRYTSSESGATGPDETTLVNGDAGERQACGVLSSTS